MIDLLSLLKKTGAYRTVKGDKEKGTLSHAYLILTKDKDMLDDYLRLFAQLIVCKDGQPCNECRQCKLIQANAYSDVVFYPRDKESVTVEAVSQLIEESYIKPLENDKKIFIISQAQDMNNTAQNKLLKTLEEPPSGVHIIMGATSEFPLLSTVKSRVKKLEIPPFNKQELFESLVNNYNDEKRLKNAIACGDGTVGKAIRLYGDDKLTSVFELVIDTLLNMKSSSNVLDYSTKILAVDGELDDFLSVLELTLRDMLVQGERKGDMAFNVESAEKLKNAERFNRGAILYALDKITEANRRKKFNANPTMLIEWLLFQILEGKYKWQKL